MGIKVFVYTLLIISLLSFFATVSNEVKTIETKDIALITFNDSTLYTLNDTSVSKIVKSAKAMRYKNRDEMYDATFVLRAKSEENISLTDIISADFILKRGPRLKLVDHVKYNRGDFVSLKTDILHYNMDTKIAYNNKPFIGTYYGHYLIGSELYIDAVKTYFKSQKSHFEIDLKEN